MFKTTTLLALLGLALPLAAQNAEEGGERAALLRLRTKDVGLAQMLAMQLGGDPSKVVIPEKGFTEVILTYEKEVKYSSLPTEMGERTTELSLRPNALVELFGDKYREMAQQIKTMGGMALALQGAPPAETAALLDALIDLPNQLVVVFVRSYGSVETVGQKGIKIEISFVAQSKTDLDFWIRRATSGSKGVANIAGEDSMASVRLDLSQDSVRGFLGPLVDAMATIAPGRTPKERVQDREYTFKFLDMFDGTMAMSVGADLKFQSLIGLRKPEEYAASLEDEGYLEWWSGYSSQGGKSDVELVPAALTHRDVPALKMTVESEPNPMAPTGTVTGFRAVAGDVEVSVNGSDVSEGDMHEAIDRVLDAKAPRSGLGGSTWLAVDVDLGKILAMVPVAQLPPPIAMLAAAPEGPRHLSIRGSRAGMTLIFTLELK